MRMSGVGKRAEAREEQSGRPKGRSLAGCRQNEVLTVMVN